MDRLTMNKLTFPKALILNQYQLWEVIICDEVISSSRHGEDQGALCWLRGQRAEGRGQRVEGRGQRAEGRG